MEFLGIRILSVLQPEQPEPVAVGFNLYLIQVIL